ncbi:uncharacterized protein LOC105697012 [Orussus abietinus]|uniref:uncharacterized protein LOC105697012 n=1 Tax=Orussus abietinus TaxID=222816 RepID=UPI000C715E2F|nr:uncharacterized protein LOC105697012 [Orussus abietinus]
MGTPSAPVLSVSQQKRSLSAKKKGPPKAVRNVLVQPFESLWPVLKKEDCKPVEKILRAKSIIFGANAVMRALEKGDVCSVLLNTNIDPPFATKHIVVMCQGKAIPIILMQSLKSITLQALGFASIVIALKKHVADSTDNYFYKLHEAVCNIASNLSVPRTPVQLFQSGSDSEDSLVTMDDESNMEIKNGSNTPKVPKTCRVPTDLYLYRSSEKERAFVPPGDKGNCSGNIKSSDDFVPLGKDLDPIFKDHGRKETKKPKRYIDLSESADNNPKLNDFVPLCSYSSETAVTKDETQDMNSSNAGCHDPNDEQSGISQQINNPVTKPKKHKQETATYIPLKVKRLQGNCNRLKATKVSKVKKK